MAKSPLDADVVTEVVRFDQPIILATRRDLAEIRPARLKVDLTGYRAGQVLARRVSTGEFEKWSAVSGASYDTVCILFESLTALDQPATGTALARVIAGGRVYTSRCIELDATARTQLGARDQTDARGVAILKF